MFPNHRWRNVIIEVTDGEMLLLKRLVQEAEEKFKPKDVLLPP